MKIAVVAPVEETIPPQRYGGTEWITYYVAHLMGEKGHQVDLYAAGNSSKEKSYNLIPIVKDSLRFLPGFFENLKLRETGKLLSLANAAKLIQENNYDIIHNHASWRFLIFSDFISHPILTTHHGPLSIAHQNLVFLKNKNQPHISISQNQRRDFPELNFVATIYNGLDLSLFPYFEAPDLASHNYMMFLARMSEEKGVVEAATVAKRTKKKLFVAVKVDKVDEPYFEKFLNHVDNQNVVLTGELDLGEKLKFLKQARCLIAPIKWEEPFGLMFIEAMACGTPVVAFARGSIPEIVKDGQTGFVVNESNECLRGDWIIKETGIEGLCQAVERIFSLPEEEYRQMRRACRKQVEENFTARKMVDEYEKVYEKILAKEFSQG